MRKEIFEVTDQHIKLISNMNVSWDGCEFGAPAIDCKRPYGNSEVFGDIAQILGFITEDELRSENSEEIIEKLVDEFEEEFIQLHEDCQTVLQILVDNLSVSTGLYERQKYGGRWTKK